MPKKGRSRSRSRSRSRGGARGSLTGPRAPNAVTRLFVRTVVNTAVSQAASTVNIGELNLTIANLGDRVINVGDTFMYWRLVKLRYYQTVQVGASTAGATAGALTHAEGYTHGAAFIPISNLNYAAPTSVVQLGDMPEMVQQTGLLRAEIHVNRSGLIGAMMTKWLTTNTTSSGDFQSAGTLSTLSISPTIADAGAQANLRGIMEFVIEFKEPIDTALIPNQVDRGFERVVTNLRPNRITEIGVDGKVTSIRDDISLLRKSVRFKEEKERKEGQSNPVSVSHGGYFAALGL
jgi:hypothetical protein